MSSEPTPAQRLSAFATSWDMIRHTPDGELVKITTADRTGSATFWSDLRAVLADNERLTAEVDGARAVQAELDTELATAKRRLETSYQRFDQLADQLHQVVRELAEAKADFQRAEAEVSRWVKADSADIAAGSYAAEVERLTGELADTRAKLAAASRALAAGSGLVGRAQKAEFQRDWLLAEADDDTRERYARALAAEEHRRIYDLGDFIRTIAEPAQPPAVAAPDAQDRAGTAQEGRGGDSGAETHSETSSAKDHAEGTVTEVGPDAKTTRHDHPGSEAMGK